MTFDTKGTTPQQTEKSKLKESCKGTVVFYEDGSIKSCSKGYINYSEGYSKKERKYTFTEKIKNFINSLVGWGFWGLVLLIILVPGFSGWIIGRVFNSVNKAFDQTILAIKKFRKTSTAKEELDNFLRAEQDTQTKKLIATKRIENV